MKPELSRLAICLGVFLLLRILFSFLAADQPFFLLAPINWAVQWFTGTSSMFVSGLGYYFQSLGLVIDRSVAGFHFLLVSFLMTAFILIRSGRRSMYKILLFSLSTSYVLTLLVSICRMCSYVMLLKHDVPAQTDISEETLRLLSAVTSYVLISAIFYLILVWLLFRPGKNVQ